MLKSKSASFPAEGVFYPDQASTLPALGFVGTCRHALAVMRSK